MSNQTLNLNDTLYQYMLSVSLCEPDILKSLRETTHKLSSTVCKFHRSKGN
jgi:hypothetical protein